MSETARIFPQEDNKLRPNDRAARERYRFVLSFPPHLVRNYISKFQISPGMRVLDPFCGTGTTLVECKKAHIESVGIEANPMAHFAGEAKTDWTPDPDALIKHARQVATVTRERLQAQGIDETSDLPIFAPHMKPTAALQELPIQVSRLLIKNSISPRPLHKTLTLLETLDELKDSRFSRHERLALAKALVSGISNLRFGPEVGVGPRKEDAPVVTLWLETVNSMARDLHCLRCSREVKALVHRADSRRLVDALPPGSVEAVITSPPYPNEKDYTRATRLESVLLGFVRDKNELRTLKHDLVRSNTRGVYSGDHDDDYVLNHPEIQHIAATIEARRVELGKTSGFERLYAKVTKLYFGGMARHLSEIQTLLRPGAQLAYVVGDQASYFRILIPTGRLLAKIAASLGYEVMGIDLFRTRLATVTRQQLREEVVLLRWPARKKPGTRPQ